MIRSEQELKNTIDELYEHAKQGKSFTGILELIMNEQTIISAVHKLKSNGGAVTPGIDGKTIDHYLQMRFEQLIGLVRFRLKNYNPKPVRRHYIDKDNGGKRPLGIPTVMDRIIQECIRMVLDPICEAHFYPHSYGFRSYRSQEHAVARIVDLLNMDRKWTLEGDIKGYFDNVNHSILIEKIRKMGIIDKRVLVIIKKMLKAGVMEKGKITPSDKGTPQGGVLSPLLANIYLNDFDWTIARMWQDPKISDEFTLVGNARRKLKQTKGASPVFLTRFADDWVIQCAKKEDCEKLLSFLKKYFKHKLKLELSTEKTVITNAGETPIKFLGFNVVLQKRQGTAVLNKPKKIVAKNYPQRKRLNKQWHECRDLIDEMFKQPNEDRFALKIEELNAKIVGIAEYWSCGTSKKMMGKLDELINYRFYIKGRDRWGKRIDEHQVPIHRLSNRPGRHQLDAKGKPYQRKQTTWAVKVDDQWIGVTKAKLTPIVYAKKFGAKLIPYTPEGRKLREKIGRKSPLSRAPLYNELQLYAARFEKDNKHAFEFIMNREYAFNQTWRAGKGYCCQACGEVLRKGKWNCHHKNPNLPNHQINKVVNLTFLCTSCHQMVEYGIPEGKELVTRHKNKIIKLIKIKNSDN
ncbi:group II intron reverse transcriptase/maturase [Peribacillus asahii]|uniref:group II intron reverse transcriptase/maturase n=1 Tax=Peribacillus asahii TaxID=228899 RepID=UPI002079AC32|nr:group II intron reverse transcriptase/maturase [Peribacillus asahii]USK62231.1 group II intron reverse transcriptase/maturase [Peribacillus asahii]